MKFTRSGRLIFTTFDPVCTAQILNLEKILETLVRFDPIWENMTSRFLLLCIPTKIPLGELVDELKQNNEIVITQMRRFVTQETSQETSLVIYTVHWHLLARVD
ncbi:hypothetical protein AVEN_237387-1 [Araneus ventricosus]|uniref:Uncharacterized protein n=1 Tax=Araneus ventricosus TaxID=182803 RepID=A0A4Y2JUS7_ARAVE|nr:hypothetical protein AVEN_237387-1 [Araneus ventricosus]